MTRKAKNFKHFKSFDSYKRFQDLVLYKIRSLARKKLLFNRFDREKFGVAINEICAEAVGPELTAKIAWNTGDPESFIDYDATIALNLNARVDGWEDEVTEFSFGYIDAYYLKHPRKSEFRDKVYITELAVNAE